MFSGRLHETIRWGDWGVAQLELAAWPLFSTGLKGLPYRQQEYQECCWQAEVASLYLKSYELSAMAASILHLAGNIADASKGQYGVLL